MAGPDLFNDEQQLKPRDEGSVYDRVFDAIIYFGVAQVLLLGSPMLWLVYLTPVNRIAVTSATAMALVVVPLTIAALRLDVVDVGQPWQKLDEAGLGTNEGFGAFLTRAVYLNTTLAVVGFGTATVWGLLPSVVRWPLAGVVAAAVTLANPWLARPTTRARVARLAFHLVGLTLVVVTTPLSVFVDVSFYSAPAVYAFLWLLVLLDSRPLLRTLRASV